MKKKVIAVLLSAVMAVSMIGCGSSSDAPAPTDASTDAGAKEAPAAEAPKADRKSVV